ncbi:hypothetical protein FFLO_04533 [Filobasidium floriforme]|uniref:Uncharacterized protein n=1 Tax=Filobasidium floriforme TaxID=5210 RepID=A0A8K0NPR9_9TREE|nr:uncharacterized protein HD553DRAFT_346703 [Filobasidium floriforme]KAG7531229.1 hypothetical protein FFLO_04533 [Filobasidium floriforme]KAH8077354.1 hypothetical protein HD553DRAFT_346703 [Filobasidium floriforme]
MQSIWLAAIDVLALLLFIRFIPLGLMLDVNDTSFLGGCSEVFHSTGQNICSCEAKSVLDVRKPSQIRFHEQDLVLQTIRAPIDDRSSHGRGALRVQVTLEDASDKDVAKQAAMRERPGTPFDVIDFGNMASDVDDDADDELEFEGYSTKQRALQTLEARGLGRSNSDQAQVGARDYCESRTASQTLTLRT